MVSITRVERRLQMAYAPYGLARRIGCIDVTRDDVEANLQCAAAVCVKPRVGAANQAPLLCCVDRFFWRTESTSAPCLDLDERDRPSLAHHEVELDAPGADVAIDDAVTSLRQVASRTRLALGAECTPIVARPGLQWAYSAGPRA